METIRASRLLQILLLLQNRGRLTCAALAKELEVTRRTILRDVDALTEAGLPIIVIRGNQGGIELGFNYRTRLTGLAADEAEALAVMLSCSAAVLNELGIREAAARAAAKLVESFPDGVRERIENARRRFHFAERQADNPDPRIAALAGAIRDKRIVHLRANHREQRVVQPTGLQLDAQGWTLLDAGNPNAPIAIADWGDINISARQFA